MESDGSEFESLMRCWRAVTLGRFLNHHAPPFPHVSREDGAGGRSAGPAVGITQGNALHGSRQLLARGAGSGNAAAAVGALVPRLRGESRRGQVPGLQKSETELKRPNTSITENGQKL